MANSSGCTPAASTAWTARTPGICFGITGPTSSWINWPKTRVLLRRTADHRKRPDRPRAMIHVLDLHHRKLVLQAVVAQVIAERPFGLQPRRVDVAGDAEIGLGVDGQLAAAADHRHAPPAQHAGQRQFAHALGQRHHGGHGHGRRPAHEHVHPQRLAAPQRRGVMGGDATLNLVVQPHLAVRARTARPKAARDTCPGCRGPGPAGRGPRYKPAAA